MRTRAEVEQAIVDFILVESRGDVGEFLSVSGIARLIGHALEVACLVSDPIYCATCGRTVPQELGWPHPDLAFCSASCVDQDREKRQGGR